MARSQAALISAQAALQHAQSTKEAGACAVALAGTEE